MRKHPGVAASLTVTHQVVALASGVTGVPMSEIVLERRQGPPGRRSGQEAAWARALVVWFLVDWCGYSQPTVGDLIGVNVGTVGFYVRQVPRRRRGLPALDRQAQDLIRAGASLTPARRAV